MGLINFTIFTDNTTSKNGIQFNFPIPLVCYVLLISHFHAKDIPIQAPFRPLENQKGN